MCLVMKFFKCLRWRGIEKCWSAQALPWIIRCEPFLIFHEFFQLHYTFIMADASEWHKCCAGNTMVELFSVMHCLSCDIVIRYLHRHDGFFCIFLVRCFRWLRHSARYLRTAINKQFKFTTSFTRY